MRISAIILPILLGGCNNAAAIDVPSSTRALTPANSIDTSSRKRESEPLSTSVPLRNRRPRLVPGASSIQGAIHSIRKPFRDLNFWGRVLHIYGSYKTSQVKQRICKVGSAIRNRLRRKRSNLGTTESSVTDASTTDVKTKTSNDDSTETPEERWLRVHEINSDRMMELCLRLRGFYLKTGQFLGTRYDFMPPNYTSKLSKLHDSVPPLSHAEIRKVLERELGGPVEDFFDELDLDTPIGSASVAQVHVGRWKETGEKCAVKIQYPNAERLMVGDLKNLRFLAEFLQRTELKFDILSAIKELQKRIVNEFDFKREAANMDFVRKGLEKSVPEVIIPRPILATRRALVMSFIEGDNVCKIDEFKQRSGGGSVVSPSGNRTVVSQWMVKKFGKKLLTVLAKAWGEQIFEMRAFNADPHPGNICIDRKTRTIGLLDWGQVKNVSDSLAVKFAVMIEAMNSRQQDRIVSAFQQLGVEVSNPEDKQSVADIAVTMLDTRVVPGYVIDPFNPMNALKKNSVSKMPPDLYFVVRTVQLMRGISTAFGIDFSLSSSWAHYAAKTLATVKDPDNPTSAK